MSKVTTLNYFAAMPGRALKDNRLSALHFRALGVIAGHERMSRNGQCCWAGRATLANTIGCHPTRLSKALADLIEFGYLTVEQHEEDGRRKGYRVVYEAVPDAAGIGIRGSADRLRIGNLSEGGNRLPSSNLNPGDRLPKGNPLRKENAEYISPNKSLDRLPQTLIYSVETEDITRSVSGRQKFGAHTHAEIVARLGRDGWLVLGTVSADTVRWLEQRASDGTLTQDDLDEARREAAAAQTPPIGSASATRSTGPPKAGGE